MISRLSTKAAIGSCVLVGKVLVVALLIHAIVRAGQSSSTAAKSANDWMKTPTQDGSPDSVSPSTRSARNLFFDAGIGSQLPLTTDSASSTHVSAGSHFHVAEKEIPVVPHRATVLGRFTGFRSVFTPSRRSIYTEVTISVQYAFEAEGSIAPGSSITIVLPGGSVEMADGRRISYLTDPEEYFLQPHSKYLLVLSYNANGDFYSLSKDWDLSTGVVRADSRAEQKRADAGRSSLVGLTEDKLIPQLQIMLSTGR